MQVRVGRVRADRVESGGHRTPRDGDRSANISANFSAQFLGAPTHCGTHAQVGLLLMEIHVTPTLPSPSPEQFVNFFELMFKRLGFRSFPHVVD